MKKFAAVCFGIVAAVAVAAMFVLLLTREAAALPEVLLPIAIAIAAGAGVGQCVGSAHTDPVQNAPSPRHQNG